MTIFGWLIGIAITIVPPIAHFVSLRRGRIKFAAWLIKRLRQVEQDLEKPIGALCEPVSKEDQGRQVIFYETNYNELAPIREYYEQIKRKEGLLEQMPNLAKFFGDADIHLRNIRSRLDSSSSQPKWAGLRYDTCARLLLHLRQGIAELEKFALVKSPTRQGISVSAPPGASDDSQG